MGEVSLLGSTL